MTRRLSNDHIFYHNAPVQVHEIGDASVALREFGAGPPLLLIHGFPVHGYTWRKLLPTLSRRFRCLVVDLPGLGDSRWVDRSDLGTRAQSHRLAVLMERLDITDCALLAHDTGGTLARLLALAVPERISRLVLIDTEIPGHRPPWLPLMCRLAGLPGSTWIFRQALKSRWFLRSSLGFHDFYHDSEQLEATNALAPYLESALASNHRLRGALRYLHGFDWRLLDQLASLHGHIKTPTLLLWGEQDKLFPLRLAHQISPQLGGPAELVSIPEAALMPHEEQPQQVLAPLLRFLAGDPIGTTSGNRQIGEPA